jgi:ArsR family metal-binding transcriptional regulator
VTFRLHGKLLTVQGNKIAVNALKDENEARKIVEWLKREINRRMGKSQYHHTSF